MGKIIEFSAVLRTPSLSVLLRQLDVRTVVTNLHSVD